MVSRNRSCAIARSPLRGIALTVCRLHYRLTAESGHRRQNGPPHLGRRSADALSGVQLACLRLCQRCVVCFVHGEWWRCRRYGKRRDADALQIGYDSAFIGTTIALDSFESEFRFNEYSESRLDLVKSNIVSVYQAGAFFGALFAYVSAYYLGRKFSLIFWSLVFLLGAGLMLGANGDRGLGLIYAGRVLAGIGVGATSNIVPIYISELAPPAVRGRLVGIYELGWQIGGLVGFWINYGLTETMEPSHKQWIIPFAVQLIPGGLLFFGAFWLRESPRWLMSKNRRELAIKNLCWIRNLQAEELYIVEEVAFIDAALEEQSASIGIGFWKPFKAVVNNRRIMWRFFLGTMLFLWQNASGINAINYYSPTGTLPSNTRQCQGHFTDTLRSLQISRRQRRQHQFLDNRHLWRRENCLDPNLVVLPH